MTEPNCGNCPDVYNCPIGYNYKFHKEECTSYIRVKACIQNLFDKINFKDLAKIVYNRLQYEFDISTFIKIKQESSYDLK